MPGMRMTALGMLATLLWLTATPGAAQSLERGALLAATADVAGFRFERSVVFVVHHDDNGSLGLIVNRPTQLMPAELFDSLAALSDYEGRVYVGGPIEPTRPLMLVNDAEGQLSGSERVLGSIHITADPELARRNAERLTDESRLRVFAGHVQWEPGQLESEITEGAWRVLPGSVDAVFSGDPLELYRELDAGDSELVAERDGATQRSRDRSR